MKIITHFGVVLASFLQCADMLMPESKLDLLESFFAGRAEMGGAMEPRGWSTPVVVGWTACICMSTLIESGCRTDGDAERSVRTRGDAAA